MTLLRDERVVGAADDAAYRPRAVSVGARLSVQLADRRAEPHADSRAAQALAVGDGGGAVGPLVADELDLVRALAASHDAVVAGVFVRASSGSGRLDLAPGVVRLLQDLSAARGAAQPAVRGGVLRQSLRGGGRVGAAGGAASPTTSATTPKRRRCARWPARLPFRARLPVALGEGAGCRLRPQRARPPRRRRRRPGRSRFRLC